MGALYLDDRAYEKGSLAVFGLNRKNCTRFKVEIEGWTIEILEYVMTAWKSGEIQPEQLREKAYKMCEKALDFYAMQRREYYAVEDAAWKYLLFYPAQDTSVMEIHNIECLTIGVTTEVCAVPDTNQTQIAMNISFGDDGIDTKGCKCAEEKWSPVLRYYRFSQMSDNLYDAYRWLYLTFEQLLQMLCPVKIKKDGRICERENEWMRRALSAMEKSSGILNNMYGLPDMHQLIEKFLKEQYRETRCKLFHAKGWAMIPNHEVEQMMLRQRCDELNNICIELLKKFELLNDPYGVMTYYGFKSIIKSSFENTNGFLSSADEKSLQDEDCILEDRTTLKLKGIHEIMPGKMDLHYSCKFLNQDRKISYHSYGAESENNVLLVAGFPMSMAFEGNVQVEQHMVIQMVNRGRNKLTLF